MHNYQNENKCLSQIKNCGLKQGFGANGGCKQCKVNKPSEDDFKKENYGFKKTKIQNTSLCFPRSNVRFPILFVIYMCEIGFSQLL